MATVKNALDYNNIIVNRNRVSGNMEYTLVIHKRKIKSFIPITEDQFNELVNQLQLKEEPSLSHKENKVYIIN